MSARVFHAELWGKRKSKYSRLLAAEVKRTEWASLTPGSPFYLFKPQDTGTQGEYEQGWRITQAMPFAGTGVKTHRDHFVLAFEFAELHQRITAFRNRAISDARLAEIYDLHDTRDWKLSERRRSLAANPNWESCFTICLYRPFDLRAYYHHEDVVELPKHEVMRHMLPGPNIALCVGRAGHVVGPGEWNIVICSSRVQDVNLFYRGGSVNLPVYLYGGGGGPEDSQAAAEPRRPPPKAARRPNLNPEFVAEMENKLRLRFVPDGLGDLTGTFGPEDVFHYIYAVFHSPTYRKRYAEFLKRDFPRVPLTSDLRLFRELCQKGADLVSLHLVESDYAAASWNRAKPPEASPFQHPITRYPIAGDDVVEKIFYVAPGEAEPGTGKPLPSGGGRVYISKDRPAARPHQEAKKGQYFEGLPPEVWEFHIGGYQVCEKWLKDRKGRKLSYDDIQHYHNIVVALKETIRLMAEIDAAIPRWPIQ